MKYPLLILSAIVLLSCKSPSIKTAQPMLSAQIDTIHIGATRSLKSLDDYFTKTYDKANLYILIDEGTYYSNGTWISGKNITLEGQGVVNLYCTELGENVMWVMG